MKAGETFVASNEIMLKPLIGRIVEVEVAGEMVPARIIEVDSFHTTLKVVPEGTKD